VVFQALNNCIAIVTVSGNGKYIYTTYTINLFDLSF
jgi:hypothetical protein